MAICPMCGGGRTVRLDGPISIYREIVYYSHRCRACRFAFADPFDNAGLDYSSLYAVHSGYAEHVLQFDAVAGIVKQWSGSAGADKASEWLLAHPYGPRYATVLKQFRTAWSAGRRLSVLEVGCGFGILGPIAHLFGHSYLGIDIATDEIEAARQTFGPWYRQGSIEVLAEEARKQKFDLVYSLDVVEHVANPRVFINHCLQVARERCIFTTPDGDAMTAKCNWFSDFPPIHLSVFSRRTFRTVYGGRYRMGFHTAPLYQPDAAHLKIRYIPPFHRRALSRPYMGRRVPADMNPESPRFEYCAAASNGSALVPQCRSSLRSAVRRALFLMGFRAVSNYLVVVFELET